MRLGNGFLPVLLGSLLFDCFPGICLETIKYKKNTSSRSVVEVMIRVQDNKCNFSVLSDSSRSQHFCRFPKAGVAPSPWAGFACCSGDGAAEDLRLSRRLAVLRGSARHCVTARDCSVMLVRSVPGRGEEKHYTISSDGGIETLWLYELVPEILSIFVS